MELLERVEQLERGLKRLRPELHFPPSATLEYRLRRLETVMEEMRAEDSHSLSVETPGEEQLRQLLGHTVYVKNDRITLHSLTADPASCVAGDQWFRSDLGKAKLAVDAQVANARTLMREGDPAAADFFDRFREFIPWVSLDGFDTGGEAGYEITPEGSLLSMLTNFNLNDDAYIVSKDYWHMLVDTGKAVTVEFIVHRLVLVTGVNVWLRLASAYADPPSEVERHIGWKLVGDATTTHVYASCGNGTAESLSDTGVDIITTYKRIRLKMVFTPGTSCKYYVNDELRATHNANLPSYPYFKLHFAMRNLLQDQYPGVYLGRVLLEKEHA